MDYLNLESVSCDMDRLPPPPLSSNPLTEVVLPWALNGMLRLALAVPPFRALEQAQIVPHHGALLPTVRFKRPGPSSVQVAAWPEQSVNAVRHHCMICVLEGEADFRIGVTERMALAYPDTATDVGYYTLRLPERTLLAIPPGVPYSDASCGHWERPRPDSAYSRILWMMFLPRYVLTHICQTDGTRHSSGSSHMIRDGGVTPFVTALLDELRLPSSHPPEVARYLMTALLFRLGYASRDTTAATTRLPQHNFDHMVDGESTAPSPVAMNKSIELACLYIQQNLSAPLTLDRIAASVFVSPSHLNRLFRKELQTSVMAYVEAARVEAAKSLLRETELSVRLVSNQLGFSRPNYLSRVFQRTIGMTPSEYRRIIHIPETLRSTED
jgi:AraC-like DNA-binding protein